MSTNVHAAGHGLYPATTKESDMPDVIKLLEADHREVEDLFALAESTSGAAKQQVVAKIAAELTLHAEVEEQIVYPAMRDAGLDSLVDEAEQEHSMVKELVAQLEAMDATTEGVDSVLAELKVNVRFHVEEEESDGFPLFRDAVDQAELQALATRVEEAKQAAS